MHTHTHTKKKKKKKSTLNTCTQVRTSMHIPHSVQRSRLFRSSRRATGEAGRRSRGSSRRKVYALSHAACRAVCGSPAQASRGVPPSPQESYSHGWQDGIAVSNIHAHHACFSISQGYDISFLITNFHTETMYKQKVGIIACIHTLVETVC